MSEPRGLCVGVAVVLGGWRIDRQDDGVLDVARRTLRQNVELSKRRHLIAPELEAHGAGHPESVDVHDPTAHRELRDVVDEGHPLEPNGLEMRCQVLKPVLRAVADFQPSPAKRAGQTRALEHRTSRRHEQAHATPRDLLQRLDALAGDLEVRLDLAESLPRRIERHRLLLVVQRRQIGEPPFGVGQRFRDDDEESPLAFSPRERGGEGGVAGPGQAGDR